VSEETRGNWLRGRDLNPRPSGYEPDELPGCSTPRFIYVDKQGESKLKKFNRKSLRNAQDKLVVHMEQSLVRAKRSNWLQR
jgi:hypothetical protein